MVGGGLLVVAAALSSSSRLQCGAGGGAATGQTGRGRDPLWKKQRVYEDVEDENDRVKVGRTN